MNRDNKKLYVGAAIGIVLAAAGGFGVAKLTTRPAPAESPKADEKAADTVAIDANRIAAAGILVQPVSSGGLGAEILASANVAAAPDGQAVVTARAGGAITRIFKRLGDPVKAGETIALVESRDAAAIAADRASAAAKATLAQTALERERYLFSEKVSPKQDLDQAQAEAASADAEARRAQMAAGAAHVSSDGRSVLVTSPIAGRITSTSASIGSFVPSETELFRVTDPRRIQIEASVTAADAGRIVPGDRAQIEVSGRAPLDTTVRAVTPALNAETRAATVVLTVPEGSDLQPGAIVRVRVLPKAADATAAIVVPDEAVQSIDGRDSVFLRTPKGFTAKPVTIGRRGAGRVEIVGGLTSGAQIATKNAFLLKAELGKTAEGDE